MNSQILATVGMVQSIAAILDADRIESAVMMCGDAGRWTGVVPKGDLAVGDKAIVFLQDALLPAGDPRWEFMEKKNWRIKVSRFRGAPSECLIIAAGVDKSWPVGLDLTQQLGVNKYEKPVPAAQSGEMLGYFPRYIPRTDEPNYQTVPNWHDLIHQDGVIATIKADGTSCTIWRDEEGQIHVASRNLDLRELDSHGNGNLYWQTARQYDLDQLPYGLAVQCEIVGEGVQKNPMGFRGKLALAFAVYDFEHRQYAHHDKLEQVAKAINMKTVDTVKLRPIVDEDDLRQFVESIKYPNGKPAEGVVFGDREGKWSFKALNLNY